MPFTLLPAIDLTQGGLGVFTPSGPVGVDAFGGDPVAAAASFAGAGIRAIHVVDMDLALTGEPRNRDVVRAIHEGVPGVLLQASGGIADAVTASAYLAAGASRVVLGSAALADEDALRALLAAPPGDLLVGVEVEGGRIRPRGRPDVDLELVSTLGWLAFAGARGLLVTAVARVGTAAGPDVDVIRRAARTGLPTVAAGGIATLADLEAVRDAGAIGAVVGRAAIEGTIDLGAALAWAAV